MLVVLTRILFINHDSFYFISLLRYFRILVLFYMIFLRRRIVRKHFHLSLGTYMIKKKKLIYPFGIIYHMGFYYSFIITVSWNILNTM